MEKKTLYNIFFSIGYQVISVVIGIFLPRLIMLSYGASIYGTVSTINNIMNYIMLLNAGLSTAAMQSLYKPIVNKNWDELSGVYSAIRKYYYFTGVLFIIAIVGVAVVLPFIIGDEIPHNTVALLMVIMGMQYVLENMIMNAEMTILKADNRLYAVNIINSISYLLRGCMQLLLIYYGASLLIVMAVPVLLVMFRAMLMKLQVNKHFSIIDKNAHPIKGALSKRKNAMIHQISGLVLNNTDVILLSIFWSQIVVSKYAVYSMIFSYLYLFMSQIFSYSFVAQIGRRLVRASPGEIVTRFSIYEYVTFFVISIVYSTTMVVLIPFIRLYTNGVSGIVFADNNIGMLFIIYGIANALRIPALTYIDAAGLYKETQLHALIEMILNLSISVILCPKLGIAGVLIGTIVSFLYRTVISIWFTNKTIIHIRSRRSFIRVGIVIMSVAATYFINTYFFNVIALDWIEWILVLLRTLSIAIGISSIAFIIVDKNSFSVSLKKVQGALKNRKLEI